MARLPFGSLQARWSAKIFGKWLSVLSLDTALTTLAVPMLARMRPWYSCSLYRIDQFLFSRWCLKERGPVSAYSGRVARLIESRVRVQMM